MTSRQTDFSRTPVVCECGRFHSAPSWQEDGWNVEADAQKLKLPCACGIVIHKTEGHAATYERLDIRKPMRAA